MQIANSPMLPLGTAAHAAKRAADMVSILQSKNRLGYEAVVDQLNATLLAYGEQDAVTYADLDELKAASKKLFTVFAAQSTMDAVVALNTILSEFASKPRLSNHSSTSWHLHVDSNDDASWAEWFVSSSALGLAILLAEKQRNPGGLCASPPCRRPFIDLGKGGGRTYCSPRCATRERVAAYRKKH